VSNASTPPQPGRPGIADAFGAGTALALTLLLAALHLRLWTRAGALWRDEANSVNVATLPNLGELWRHLELESLPLLWFLLLRAWSAAGGADSDAALRVLGLGLGLAVIAICWGVARRLGYGAPSVSLLLLLANPAVLRWGDSLRGLGLALLCVLLAFAATLHYLERPGRRPLLAFCAAGLLCVHSAYTSAVLLLAIVLAAVAVLLRRGDRSAALGALLGGGLAAASLLVYLPTLSDQRVWAVVNQHAFSLPEFAQRFAPTLSGQHPALLVLWPALLLVAWGLGLAMWRCPGRLGETPSERERALFAALAGGLGVVLFPAFLWWVSYPTQVWYYLTLLGLAALSLDVVLLPRLARPAGQALSTWQRWDSSARPGPATW
jgi:hypothetical protein